MNTARLFIDLAKILGRTVVNVVDTGDYKITVIIERKVDDDSTGILVDRMSFEKKMSSLEARVIAKKIEKLINE